MTMSLDQSKVYINARIISANIGVLALWGIDVADGTVTLLAEVDDGLFGHPGGIAVVTVPPPPIPTVSQWGIVVLMLLLLTAGTVLLSRCGDVTMRIRSRYPGWADCQGILLSI